MTRRPKRRACVDLRAAKRGDIDARRHVVEHLLPSVRRIAGRYSMFGMSSDDLAQEGALGLLDAIDGFDSGRQAEFAAFANWRARRAILNALTAQARLVRLPKQVVEQRRALRQARDRLTLAADGNAPSLRDLAAATGLSESVIEAIDAVPGTVASLEAPAGDATTLQAFLADDSSPDPEAETLAREEATLVDLAVEHLPDKQRFVIREHYGFGGDAVSLRTIARELDISPQRVSALERAGLRQLEDELRPALGRAD